MPENRNKIDRVNILGVSVSAINMPMAVDTILGWIKRRERNYVTVTGVHGVIESQLDPNLLTIHNKAGLVTPDGMPLVWLARKWGNKNVDRVYGPDLMLEICNKSIAKGYRHYLYGGKEGVPELLRKKLEIKFPGIKVVGTLSPPFRDLTEEENCHIIDEINNSNTDIVWIGLSTPKQEKWMADHIDKLQASVLIGVGAAFDFHAGLVRQAPKWVQRSGLEWLFRTMMEPRRLWRRYLRNNSLFIYLMLQQVLGLKKYSGDWNDVSKKS